MSMQWLRSDGEVPMPQREWGRNTSCSGLEAAVTQVRRVFTQRTTTMSRLAWRLDLPAPVCRKRGPTIGRAAPSFQGMPGLVAVHVIVSQTLESSNRSQDGRNHQTSAG
jgi:hypothetical protein